MSEDKCPCLKTCCENPQIYYAPEDGDEDGYHGVSICANCHDSCHCNM
jgi:hypothetical protein